MSEDCIFCAIVDGEIPSRTVYEDETTMAFLDANPMSRGHTVVIPRDHYEHVEDLPEDLARDLFATMRRVTPAIQDAVGADASNLGFNNGTAAGQEIDHVHGHVIPRFEGDGGNPMHVLAGGHVELSDDEQDQILEDVTDRL